MQTIANYPVHPAAALFPMMPEVELAELAEDIKKHGLLYNVIIFEGKILDGRNRALACQMAGVTIRTVIAEIPEDMLPTEYVLSLNKHRRHLTPSQRAAVAVEALPLLEAEAEKRQKAGVVAILPQGSQSKKSRDIAAAKVGASPRYVQDAKTLQEKAPEIFQEVKEGKKTIPEAKREAGIIKQSLKNFDFGKRLENYSLKGIELLNLCEDKTDVESLEEEVKGLLERIHEKHLEFKKEKAA